MISIVIVVNEVINLVSSIKKVITMINMVISYNEMVSNVTMGVYRLVRLFWYINWIILLNMSIQNLVLPAGLKNKLVLL